MPARSVLVENVEQLAAARTSYLTAVEDGEERVVIELSGPALGFDEPGLGGFDLQVTGAMEPPAIDLVLRAREGMCAIPYTQVTLSARTVTVEGVALVAGEGPQLRVRAADTLRLSRVSVLGGTAGTDSRSMVEVMAAGRGGLSVKLGDCAIARSDAILCMLGLGAMSGAWLQEIVLERCALDARRARALIAIEAVRRLRLHDCHLDASAQTAAIGFGWPPLEGEITGCRIAPGSHGVIEYMQGDEDAPPLPIVDGDGAGGAAALDAAVSHLRGVDERLAALAR